MFIIANLLSALALILQYVLQAYMYVIIARAVLSWVNPDPYNPIVRFIYNITEPVLYAVRRRLPFSMGGIDLSPMIVILAIIFLEHFVVSSLVGLARSIGANPI